jgi:CHAT domain-containing protein
MNFKKYKSGRIRPKSWIYLGLFTCSVLLFSIGFSNFNLRAESTNIAKSSEPLAIAQKGQQLYEAGKIDRAIDTWQEAADAYDRAGNKDGVRESLLNKASAQQTLGLYPRSCQTLLQAFGTKDLNCKKLREKSNSLEEKFVLSRKEKIDLQPEVIALVQPIAEQPDSKDKALGLLRIGDFLRENEYLQTSEKVLQMSRDVAKKTNSSQEESAALLSLGNTARAIGDREQNKYPKLTTAFNIISTQDASADAALAPFEPALNYYQQAELTPGSFLNGIEAKLNQFSLLVEINDYWQDAIGEVQAKGDSIVGAEDPAFRTQILQGADSLKTGIDSKISGRAKTLTLKLEPDLAKLPPSRSSVYARINFAQSLKKIAPEDTSSERLLMSAAKDAQEINNNPARSQALGLLAGLYENRGQLSEAQKLTEEAIRLAPPSETPEIAYQWQTQLGSILHKKKDRQGSIAAYDTAFNTIKALRSDLAKTTSVEPIYRDFVSVLLETKPTQVELNKARDVLESLQIAEIDNFFRDPCSQASNEPVRIDDVDKRAAVIYPIILPNSLQVIANLPGKNLIHYTANVSKTELDSTVNKLHLNALTNPRYSEELRGSRGSSERQTALQKSLQQSLSQDIYPSANQLYKWILEPAEPEIAKSGIKTLVFVLDGSLRKIPMSLLFDGKQYLIEKDYNIAVASGLQLTAPQPLARKPLRVLAAGVTSEVPELELPPIPKVEDELKIIKNIFPNSQILLNKEFTRDNLRKELKDAQYPVVHLATHGQFSSTSDQTFIVSGDSLSQQGNSDPNNERGNRKSGNTVVPTPTQPVSTINVKDFGDLLRVRSASTSPIELLVLSACETATGDDKAILGLAGAAVRAGARSTIATLWGANDEATSQLMGYFYRNLFDDRNASKAQSLRQAQLKLLKTAESEYQHPYYWAPFVLVGNWL